MDADDDIAEERLLRVIEKGQARTASVALSQSKGTNLFKVIRLWFARNYSRPIGREIDPTLKLMKSLSSLLWFVLACFGIYFAMDYISHRGQPFQGRVFRSVSQSSSSVLDDTASQEKVVPESHYVDALQNPNPFTGTAEELKVVEEVARGPSASEQLSEMAKGLVIVGINRGPSPDAIIENAQEKRTFFVKVGDKVNEMTVKEIKRDTVVLSYQGQDVEIV